ncbi:MAG: carboxypeptidase regulatory-like domain-containing protein [Candidatus Methanomethylicaceae archaeon]
MRSKLSLISVLILTTWILIGFLLVSQITGASSINGKPMAEGTATFAKMACNVGDPLITESSKSYSAPPQLRPVSINIQLSLETASDKEGVERILSLIETHNPNGRTTVFVSPYFASHDPDFVQRIESRGHQIAVLGAVIEDKGRRPLIELSYTEQRSVIERAVLLVRAAVRHPEKVLDWKPQDLQWNSDTLRALQDLRLRSITGLFPCNENFKCQCPYALSLGKVTFPYPIQTGFWAIPISEIERDSQSVTLDDQQVIALRISSQDFFNYLMQEYDERRKTGEPLIISLHGRITGMNETWLSVFEQFLEHVTTTDGKVVPLSNFVTQSYITDFDVQAPFTSVPVGSQATLTVTYRSNLYCPKYRFRAYGTYDYENWELISSRCFFVYTGDHSFTMAIPIPRQPSFALRDRAYNTPFITDHQLEDYNSMSINEIKSFLTMHNSYFRQPVPDVDGTIFDLSEVIVRASSQYRINPMVLLATLQKESSGVTRTTRPSDATMRYLMGCLEPNTARQQVMCAAERFRSYYDQLTNTGSTHGWAVGKSKMTCDGVEVTPATKAVATQFAYTPQAGNQWGGNGRDCDGNFHPEGIGGVYLFYYFWNRFGFATSYYTVKVVGQASFGTCNNDDPNWPTLDSYAVMKEVQIRVLPRCIPLSNRIQGNPENRLDVIFVPDEDYGSSQSIETWLPTFLNHINAQIDQRLGGKPPVTGRLDWFNFYYTREQGDAEPTYQIHIFPPGLLRDCSFADAIVVLHNEEFGDWTIMGGRTSLYSSEGPIGRSFIHESGHGLFGLADEYDGNTRYFQPNPHPNIWDTEQACRDYAANAGWNPDDCVKFTDRQGDWWKLGTTRYIMYDGSYFDNGWGPPASRRIEWVLGQYTATVQAMANLTSPLASNTTHLNLSVSDSGFAVNQIARLKDSPPTQPLGMYDYRARFISFDGQILGEFGFSDPRHIYAESGYIGPTYLPSATFSLNLPYFYNASTIQIYTLNGQLVKTIDISTIASGGISGTVTSSSQPVRGAQIDIIGPDLTTTSTDANGRYLIRGVQPGSYILRVIPPADTNLLPTEVSIYVSRGQITTSNITLQLGINVRGRVANAFGEPIPDAILYLTGYETPRYRTDRNGYYLIRGLTPGNYTLNIDSLEDYYIYVNDRFVTLGTSVVLTATAGEGLTVNFIKPALVYLPIILKNAEHVPYHWFDATAGGTIVAQGDDTYQYVALPFPFNFYGNTYTGLYVSSNGFVSFGSGYSHYSNSCIPSIDPPNNAIYAFWDDLVPTGGTNGNIYVKQIDSGTFVIEWYRVKRYGSSDYETFEIVLRSDHSIVLQYQSVSNTGSATVGIENAIGTLAKQYLCNGVGSPLRNQLAIRYNTP